MSITIIADDIDNGED